MHPTIGRIVQLNIGDDEWRPAIVVRVWSDECVNLQLFVDGSNDIGKLSQLFGTTPAEAASNSGVLWVTSACAGEDPGEWRWPPRR